jgi:hypothetical protein
MRYLFIISRNHPWLYTDLLERFRDDANVEVILDRRVSERRTAAVPGQGEKRKKDRRRPVSPNDDLRVRSYYIVTR